MADNYEKLGLEVVADDKASATLNSIAEAIRGIQINISGVDKKQTSTSKKAIANNKLVNKSLGSLVAKWASLALIVNKTAKFFAGAVTQSGSFVENLNLFAVTFGKNYQDTANWGLDFAENLGVASNEIIKTTGLFKQLTDAIGIAEDAGTSMAKTLTMLGYDIASFYNISIESAVSKLQAGIFSGQIRPLRAIGIDVSVNAVDEYVKKLGTSSAVMTQSQKVMVRMLVALEAAENSFGDMGRTINTLTNQQRVLNAQWDNFKLAIGDLINEPLRVAITYVNGFIMAITKLIRVFKPINIESKTAENAIDGVTESLEDAEKAASGDLLDFDKFRSLGSGTGAGNIGVTDALTAALEEQLEAYDEIYSNMDDINNKAVEIADNIKSWLIITDEDGAFVEFTSNGKAALTILSVISALLAGAFVSNIISAMNKVTGLSKAISGLTSIISFLTSPIGLIVAAFALLYIGNEDFRESVNELVGTLITALKPALETIGNILNILMPTIRDIIDSVGKQLAASIRMCMPFIEIFASALKIIFDILNPILEVLAKVITKIMEFKQAVRESVFGKIMDFGSSIWSGIKSFFGFADGGVVNFEGYANGGITTANYIMTNENGRKEWVGNMGSSTAVVNDSQMSEIMYEAVRQGAYAGMLQAISSQTSKGSETSNISISIDGENVFTAVKKVASNKGLTFAKA